ncbi:cation:proton antiporter [Peptostreptococcus equinus]|uniref:Cation:proton antiporter n=1 Tax=Peptostreptococcus equinus TaxID=3003601 RepID=A0ABY7JUG3_9FIRM|nr:cation:proton antiporter [Peptostreptococcus sp. CBA3647]WAW15542.1 cation:proton antiporter [Peptostreptococcus sp. CBA3647]
MGYNYLISISIILLSTKILGGITEKIRLPQVVGALVAGVLIGPSFLGIVDDTSFINQVAEIGVIILMFMAGLDTDINQLKRRGVSYLIIAIFGVLIPLIGGFITYFLYFGVNLSSSQELLKALFVGVILTATSVSITVEALRELGTLKGKIGNSILGAAILDDIIGIVILTIVTSFKDSHISISSVLIKIGLYFVIISVFGILVAIIASKIDIRVEEKLRAIYVFALVLIVSYLTEEYAGIADITGAYLTGIVFCRYSIRNELVDRMSTLSFLFFSPIFFASIGLKTNIESFDRHMLVFTILLTLVAIFTKMFGAGLGAKLCKYTNAEALNIGVGMVSRGEVALIIAQKGFNLNIVDKDMFSPIVIMIIVTTVITPIILKYSMKNGQDKLSLKQVS